VIVAPASSCLQYPARLGVGHEIERVLTVPIGAVPKRGRVDRTDDAANRDPDLDEQFEQRIGRRHATGTTSTTAL